MLVFIQYLLLIIIFALLRCLQLAGMLNYFNTQIKLLLLLLFIIIIITIIIIIVIIIIIFRIVSTKITF